MKRLSFALLLACFAFPAQAMPGGMSGSFDKADANKDGFLNWEEFHAAFSSLKREAFDIIDANRDGRISKEEWNAFRVGHGKPDAGQEATSSAAPKASPGTQALPLLNAPGKARPEAEPRTAPEASQEAPSLPLPAAPQDAAPKDASNGKPGAKSLPLLAPPSR